MSDPRTVLHQMIAVRLAAEHRRRAADQVADSPEGHAAALADAVMDLLAEVARLAPEVLAAIEPDPSRSPSTESETPDGR